MRVTASAPGRCGIIGNPSDIYGGNVLSCSIPARAICTLSLTDEELLPEDRRLWLATCKRFPLDCAVRVEWSTTVPRSSGLSGSTALLASTLACVLALRGESPDLGSDAGRVEFAELVRDVELKDAEIKCGYQDAYMICNGGLRLMRFAGKHPIDSGPRGRVEEIAAPLPFLLVTTGVERLSGSVHGPMMDRWLNGDRDVIESMLRIQELALEGTEALCSGDYGRLGGLMDENHRLMAALGGSGHEIDALIAACKQCGAISAKLAGAGLGGTVIALTEDADGLEASLRSHGYSKFLRPTIAPGVRYEA